MINIINRFTERSFKYILLYLSRIIVILGSQLHFKKNNWYIKK